MIRQYFKPQTVKITIFIWFLFVKVKISQVTRTFISFYPLTLLESQKVLPYHRLGLQSLVVRNL